MSKFHGRNVDVHVEDSGGVKRDISVDVDSVECPSEQDTVDVTGFGDTKKNYVTGLQDTTITMGGQFDDLATTGSHAVLSALLGGTAGRAVHVWPKGSTTAFPVFQGSYLLSSYNVNAAINGAVKFNAKFTPFGTVGGSWTTTP